MRLQRHPLTKQAIQHATQHLGGIGIQPVQRGLLDAQTGAVGITLYLLTAHATALLIPGKQRHGHLRLIVLAVGDGQVFPVNDTETLGDFAGLFQGAEGAEVQAGGAGFGHQDKTRLLCRQLAHDRPKQPGQGNGAVQLIPGILAHAVGQPHMHGKLHEIGQLRMVKRTHGRGWIHGLPQYAEVLNQALLLRTLHQRVGQYASNLPGVTRIGIVAA